MIERLRYGQDILKLLLVLTSQAGINRMTYTFDFTSAKAGGAALAAAALRISASFLMPWTCRTMAPKMKKTTGTGERLNVTPLHVVYLKLGFQQERTLQEKLATEWKLTTPVTIFCFHRVQWSVHNNTHRHQVCFRGGAKYFRQQGFPSSRYYCCCDRSGRLADDLII